MVIFLVLTLKLPIQTSLSVAPKLPVSLCSGAKCINCRKTSTPLVSYTRGGWVVGSIPFTVITNIFLTEFSKNFWVKLSCYRFDKHVLVCVFLSHMNSVINDNRAKVNPEVKIMTADAPFIIVNDFVVNSLFGSICAVLSEEKLSHLLSNPPSPIPLILKIKHRVPFTNIKEHQTFFLNKLK